MLIKLAEDNYKLFADLANQLWPHASLTELETEFYERIHSDQALCLAVVDNGIGIGFVHASTRADYVEGCETSPVAYLEGIYIASEHRHKGHAKQLIAEVESWAVTKGYRELASDCELTNSQSISFHSRLGFEETNRIVCFRKKL